jgi:hypothetical protein
MIIYVDENMSPYLARGFDILQRPESTKLRDPIEVKSIKDVFGEGALDEDWIPLAGEQNSCIITQDYSIQRITHQRELCEQYGLGMFYFKPPSKNGFLYWDMLKMLVKHWPDIIKISQKKKRPFAYKASSRGKLEPL